MQQNLRKFSGPYPYAYPEPKFEVKSVSESESESVTDIKQKEKDDKIYKKNLQKERPPIYPNISLLSYSFRPFGLNYGAYYAPYC